MPRAAGTANAHTTRWLRLVAQRKKTPVEFLLDVMDGKLDGFTDEEIEGLDKQQIFALRFEAAKAAAPYCHPKLVAHKVQVPDEPGDQERADAKRLPEIRAIVDNLARQAMPASSEVPGKD